MEPSVKPPLVELKRPPLAIKVPMEYAPRKRGRIDPSQTAENTPPVAGGSSGGPGLEKAPTPKIAASPLTIPALNGELEKTLQLSLTTKIQERLKAAHFSADFLSEIEDIVSASCHEILIESTEKTRSPYVGMIACQTTLEAKCFLNTLKASGLTFPKEHSGITKPELYQIISRCFRTLNHHLKHDECLPSGTHTRERDGKEKPVYHVGPERIPIAIINAKRAEKKDFGEGAYGIIREVIRLDKSDEEWVVKKVLPRTKIKTDEPGPSPISSMEEFHMRASLERECLINEALKGHRGIMNVEAVSLYPGKKRQGLMLMKKAEGDMLDKIEHTKHTYATCIKEAKSLIPVIQALADMHARGIIHNDIKLDNCLFKGDETYLADFGYAFPLDQLDQLETIGLKLNTQIIWGGTYSPPEADQIKKGTLIPTSDHAKAIDIWGIGVILYMILTRTHVELKGTLETVEKLRADLTPFVAVGKADTEINTFERLARIAYCCLSPTPLRRPNIARILDILQRLPEHL